MVSSWNYRNKTNSSRNWKQLTSAVLETRTHALVQVTYIYSSAFSSCMTFRGSVIGLSPSSGSVLWTLYSERRIALRTTCSSWHKNCRRSSADPSNDCVPGQKCSISTLIHVLHTVKRKETPNDSTPQPLFRWLWTSPFLVNNRAEGEVHMWLPPKVFPLLESSYAQLFNTSSLLPQHGSPQKWDVQWILPLSAQLVLTMPMKVSLLLTSSPIILRKHLQSIQPL